MQNLEQLQQKIEEHFDLDELKDLAFSVDAKWDDIPGQRLKDKARELILLMQRRKGLPRLIEALQAERPHGNWLEGTDDDTPCPYRGLHAFREEDEYLFFGRDSLIDRLLTTAKAQNFVTVLGPSGSGKSSVVMAGLLPRLRQENRWLVATFRPGDQPFHALAMSLLPLLYPHYSKLDLMDEEEKLVDRLRQKPGSLQQVIEWILQEQEPGTRLLLVADQFEELYTLCQDRDLRHAFLDQLLAAVAAANAATQPSHLLLLTLRSDFLGQFQNDHASFVEALQTGTVFMQPMDRDGLRQAIKYPALNAGVEFDGTLVERILEDVVQAPGQLPLLEFALSLLWERRENGAISHSAYEAIGRVKGALAQYADEVYGQLTEAEQEQARFIFLKLVQPGEGTEDTRRLARKAEIGEELWPLVTRLADARLIVTGQNKTGKETVEVIHEALIWGWQQLQDWVNNDREFLTWHKQLHHAYQQWANSGQAEGDLLRGTFLQQTSTWLVERGNDLIDEEKRFIQTSVNIGERDQKDLLIGRITRGEAQGHNLSQALLVNAFLAGVNLVQAVLSMADLSGANLTAANLSGANLHKANLTGTNLIGTELVGTDLTEANLKGAFLVAVDLRETDLRGANLSDANLISVDLRGTKLSKVNLHGTKLSKAKLSKAKLSRVDMCETDLHEADLREANLNKTNLSEANLKEANLSKADLRGADLSKADLREADLSKANLSKADLSEADLSGANLSGTDLKKANLSGTLLKEANLSKADLRETDLSGALLWAADVWGADLWDVILSGIDSKNVILRNALLKEANLSKTQYNATTKWPENFDPQAAGAILVE